MFNGLCIREAGLADAEALFEAHQDSVQNFCAEAHSPAQMAVWFEGRSSEMYRPALEARQIWIAENADQIAGFVGFSPGEVTHLFVRKASAGKGLGKQLFALELAKAQAGYTDVGRVFELLPRAPHSSAVNEPGLTATVHRCVFG